MSLAIIFKGAEGIVLAADSRVTLSAFKEHEGYKEIIPATFDNATKLLQVNGQDYIGAVTYGLGAIGIRQPRTAHSFLPEFEAHLKEKKDKEPRLSVEGFAKELNKFFLNQWKSLMPEEFDGPPIIFLVGGYDEDAPYGRVFEVKVPGSDKPVEQQKDIFGITWGGQLEYITRLIKGFDPNLIPFVENELDLEKDKKDKLIAFLDGLNLPIPYPFLPLQDCVDLSMLLIKTTMEIQSKMVGVRGVGGAIDLATITRTDGFTPIQQKKISGLQD